MLSQIFKRWDIGLGNEDITFIHCANGAKIKRALRRYLPNDEYLMALKFEGWMLLRLAQVNYNLGIRLAVEKMQDEIYGGAAYRVNVEKLKEAIK